MWRVDYLLVVGVCPVREALQQATQLRGLGLQLGLPVDLALNGPVALLLLALLLPAFLLVALEFGFGFGLGLGLG
jgi:hypothetical protein